MITVTRTIQLARESHGRRRIAPAKQEPKPVEAGSMLRISCLMALAIRLEGLLISGEVCDVTELARLGHVTWARLTQIMKLVCHAPDIQEAILFLPRANNGRDPISKRELRPVAAAPSCCKQRRMWRAMQNATCSD